MRVARVVMIVFLLVGTLCLALAMERLWVAHQKVIQNVQLAGLANSRSDWYRGTLALSFERSVTQVALAHETAIPAAFRDLIDEQRAQSDTLLEEAAARLDALSSFENEDHFLREVRLARDAILDLRREADQLLAQPGDRRDPVRSRALPYELKEQIESLFAAANLLVLPRGRSSTEEMILSRIQTLAWDVREYGGRARTFYAVAALTGVPIPEASAGEARLDTSRARAGWHQIQIVSTAVTLPESLISALDAVERPFAIDYLNALTQMDSAMADIKAGKSVELPYAFSDFFAVSNAGLDAVAGIAPIAGAQIQLYWARQLQDAKRARFISVAVIAVIFLVIVISLVSVQRKLVKPLEAATSTLKDIADGNLDREFRQKKRGLDEIRVIWDALESMTQKLRSARDHAAKEKESEKRAKEGIIGELMTAFEKLAVGDLTHEIQDDYGEAYSALVMNFNKTCQQLRAALSQVIVNAQDIAQRSEHLETAVRDLSNRTDTQTDLVADTAQRLSQLSRVLNDTASHAKDSNTTVSEAAEKSDSGRVVVESAVNSMDSIRETSEEIHGISVLIDEIAFQTGLLSLNASVEAARAGEAGRGFAVVAEEVRGLANQASDAAQKVKSLVHASEKNVKEGVEVVGETGSALGHISNLIQTVKGRMTEIDQASRVQSETLEQIDQTMTQIEAMTKQNSAMVDQTTDVTEQLLSKSSRLQQVVDHFVVGTDHPAIFEADMRPRFAGE